MENSFDFITIGDSTIDTIIKIHDATVECDINHESCKICIPYGQKIPVDAIHHSPAGGASNVIVGCSRLGLKGAIYTHVGTDDQGQLIKKTLETENVKTDYIFTENGKSSNFSAVLTFQGERTIFVYHQSWYYQLPALPPCQWLYFGSMAESFTDSNIIDEICHYLEKTSAKLVFAPGTYLLKADIKRFPKLLEKCEILTLNVEESKKVLNIEPQEKVNPKELLEKLLLLGPKSVVITDAEEGSYATDGNKNLKIGIFPTRLVEKTGAGDAYVSGLIAALFGNKTLEEAMLWGTINASHVIQEIGSQKGLLNKEELTQHLKETSPLIATRF